MLGFITIITITTTILIMIIINEYGFNSYFYYNYFIKWLKIQAYIIWWDKNCIESKREILSENYMQIKFSSCIIYTFLKNCNKMKKIYLN